MYTNFREEVMKLIFCDETISRFDGSWEGLHKMQSDATELLRDSRLHLSPPLQQIVFYVKIVVIGLKEYICPLFTAFF
jgi:hypothetical protein